MLLIAMHSTRSGQVVAMICANRSCRASFTDLVNSLFLFLTRQDRLMGFVNNAFLHIAAHAENVSVVFFPTCLCLSCTEMSEMQSITTAVTFLNGQCRAPFADSTGDVFLYAIMEKEMAGLNLSTIRVSFLHSSADILF